jgi:hypothetical protein
MRLDAYIGRLIATAWLTNYSITPARSSLSEEYIYLLAVSRELHWQLHYFIYLNQSSIIYDMAEVVQRTPLPTPPLDHFSLSGDHTLEGAGRLSSQKMQELDTRNDESFGVSG